MAERFLPEISFGDDARSKLLGAGWELMAAADGSILETGFNPERIAAEAGVSRRTFYRYFPDKYEYSIAMFAAVLGHSYSDAAAAHIEQIPAYDLGDMFNVLRESSQLYWDTIGLNETLIARVSLLTLAGNSPGVLDTARAAYALSVEKYVVVWDALFDAWDLELRPPWTTARFAAFTGALVDGMVLRRLYDPDGFNSMLADIACALTPMLFRLRGDAIEEIDSVADRFADEVRRRWTEGRTVGDSLANSKLIDDALLKLLFERGLRGTTTDALAVQTGLPVEQVRVKGSIEEQVCVQVEQLFDSIESDLTFDIRSESFDNVNIFRRHGERIQALVGDNRELFQAFVEVRVTAGASESYLRAFGSLVRASEFAKRPHPSIEAESIIAYAEQRVVSEILEWPARQKPGLRDD